MAYERIAQYVVKNTFVELPESGREPALPARSTSAPPRIQSLKMPDVVKAPRAAPPPARVAPEAAGTWAPNGVAATKLGGGSRARCLECDGLRHLLAEFRRRGGIFSDVAFVLSLEVLEFLAPRSCLAVAVQTGPTRKLRRTSVRVYGIGFSMEESYLSIPRAVAPPQTTTPRCWEVRFMQYSKDGSRLALGYEDKRTGASHLQLICNTSGKVLRRFKWPGAALEALAHSPDDKTLAVRTSELQPETFELDSSICLVEACPRSPVKKVAFPGRATGGLSFSGCGRHVAVILYRRFSSDYMCEVLLLAVDTLAVTFRAEVSLDKPVLYAKATVSPTTGNIWIANLSSSFYMLGPSRHGLKQVVHSEEAVCHNLECYHSGGLVAMSFWHDEKSRGQVRVFDERSESFLASTYVPYHVCSMAFEPIGSHLVAQCRHHFTDEDVCLLILDALSLATVQRVPVDGSVLSIATCPLPSFSMARAPSLALEAPGDSPE